MMVQLKDRPLIGINTDYHAPKGKTPYSMVASGYFDSILTSGGIPVIVPPMVKDTDVNPILDKLDGFVLVGGDDLDPRKQALGPHPTIKTMPERREASDRMLVKLLQERKLPTLGIGVGMQLLNVMMGGGLYQHLPEDLPRSIPHRDPQGGAHRHIVVMEAGTRMEEIYGEGEIRVNSYHHQGIRKLAPCFRVGALAPDGLIEAFEGKDPSWWVVGVQWHPENEGNISLDTQLIETFVAASAKYRGGVKLAKVG